MFLADKVSESLTTNMVEQQFGPDRSFADMGTEGNKNADWQNFMRFAVTMFSCGKFVDKMSTSDQTCQNELVG